MADNTQLPAGGAGDNIRTIDRAGVKTQVTQLDWGGEAGPEQLVTLVNGMPVQPGTGTSWAITAASLPLPTGAATGAKQDTGNTSLSSIDGKVPALGQALAVASVPVVLTAAQLATLTPLSTVGIVGAVEVTNDVGNPLPVNGTITANAGTNLNTSLLALEAGGNLAAIKADVDKIPSQGQALAAASMPVVLTAAQVTTLTPPAAITGFALDATVAKDATLVTIDTDIKANQPRTVNLITGFALEAGHLATLDANTPTLGQKTMAGSRPVVIASDQVVPTSISSQPLPTNAAQENSGQLAQMVQLLTDIRAELRIMNENTARIGNIPDDLDARRADPYYLQ